MIDVDVDASAASVRCAAFSYRSAVVNNIWENVIKQASKASQRERETQIEREGKKGLKIELLWLATRYNFMNETKRARRSAPRRDVAFFESMNENYVRRRRRRRRQRQAEIIWSLSAANRIE